jgi:hypothetical protein
MLTPALHLALVGVLPVVIPLVGLAEAVALLVVHPEACGVAARQLIALLEILPTKAGVARLRDALDPVRSMTDRPLWTFVLPGIKIKHAWSFPNTAMRNIFRL